MSKFTRISANALDGIELESGILLYDFDPDNIQTPADEDIVCATTGGIKVSCIPTIEDLGEDLDAGATAAKDFAWISDWEYTVSFTALSTDIDLLKFVLGAADTEIDEITPRSTLKEADFNTIWFVGTRADGSLLALKLKNVLSTGGFKLQTAQGSSGTIDCEITCHCALSDSSGGIEGFELPEEEKESESEDESENESEEESEEEESEQESTYASTEYHITLSEADTVRLYYTIEVDDAEITFDWGDGDTTVSTSSKSSYSGNSNAGGGTSHSYDEAGDYTITITSLTGSFCPCVTGYAVITDDVQRQSGAVRDFTVLQSVIYRANTSEPGDRACSRSSKLSSVEFDGCEPTDINEYSFKGCSSLADFPFPETVTYIHGGAFYQCTGLTGLTLPSKLTYIGSKAFYRCTGLTGISIPDTVKTIDESAFYGCTALAELDLGDGPATLAEDCFRACTALTSLVVPDYVYRLSGFRGCTGLAELDLGDGPYYINEYAFYGCTGLTSLTIPNGTRYIYGYAFSGCTGLEEIFLGSKVKKIAEYAFRYCKKVESIEIPSNCTSIGEKAFQGCTSLVDVVIDNTDCEIDVTAFYGCSSLETITLGETVVDAEDYKNSSNEEEET